MIRIGNVNVFVEKTRESDQKVREGENAGRKALCDPRHDSVREGKSAGRKALCDPRHDSLERYPRFTRRSPVPTVVIPLTPAIALHTRLLIFWPGWQIIPGFVSTVNLPVPRRAKISGYLPLAGRYLFDC